MNVPRKTWDVAGRSRVGLSDVRGPYPEMISVGHSKDRDLFAGNIQAYNYNLLIGVLIMYT